MITTPNIVDVPTQAIARIHIVCPASQIMTLMGPGIQELNSSLAAQGVTPAGPWFTHHFKQPDETFDFDICLPVYAPVAPVGRMENGMMPAQKVARTLYTGGYEGLGQGWGQFMTWINAQGLIHGADLWEVYLKGPESGLDSSAYQTQLNRPLI